MKKLILSIITINTLIFTSCSTENSTTTENEITVENTDFISPKDAFSVEETAELLKNDVLLIDVREPDEIATQGYDVKSVLTIPLGDLENQLSNLPKDKQIIFACQGGGRSQQAFELAKANGFKNVANMEGGMNSWSEAGLPVTSNIDTLSTSCCSGADSTNCKKDANGKCITQ
jgi:rhodanese-related sulfurtransferase